MAEPVEIPSSSSSLQPDYDSDFEFSPMDLSNEKVKRKRTDAVEPDVNVRPKRSCRSKHDMYPDAGDEIFTAEIVGESGRDAQGCYTLRLPTGVLLDMKKRDVELHYGVLLRPWQAKKLLH